MLYSRVKDPGLPPNIYRIHPLEDLDQDRLDRLLYGHVITNNRVGFQAVYSEIEKRLDKEIMP